jgi:preprotein translocase subunit SecG
MEILKAVLWVIQIISAVSIIILVLLQHGKGADAGATFGSGSSSSLFGATGSANFLSRTTAIFAAVFFITTFSLVYLSAKSKNSNLGVMTGLNGKVVASSQPLAATKVNSKAASAVTGSAKSAPAKNQMPN